MIKSTDTVQQSSTPTSALTPISHLLDFSALPEAGFVTVPQPVDEDHGHEQAPRQLSGLESELIAVGEAFREEHSLHSLVERDDKAGLLQYFLPEICELAEKLDPAQRVDREDLVGEGVAEALNFLSDNHLIYERARLSVISTVERAMLDYLVANKVLDIREVVNTDMLASVGYDYVEAIDHRDAVGAARGYIDRWLGSLNKATAQGGQKASERGEMLRNRLGFGESQAPTTLEELAQRHGVTRERIRQICNKAIAKMSAVYKGPLRDIAVTLDCAETKDLIDSKKAKERSAALESSEILNRLKRELGVDFESFSLRHGLGPQRAAAFLSRLYPKLEPHVHSKLVDISQGERDRIEGPDMMPTGPSVESIQRSIVALEERKKTLAQSERINLVDQVRETYLHLFLADKEECLRQLQAQEKECQPRSAAREIFAKVREYFRTIDDFEVPGLMSKLESFQKVDVEIATRRNSFLIASEMGTGKSVEALAFALRKGARRVLIVSTQSSVHATWPNEIAKHIGDKEAVSTLSSAKLASPEGRAEFAGSRWLLVTYMTAAKSANIRMIRDLNPDLVILDECHNINHESSAQSKALLSLRPPLRLAVSGSPFKNRLMEIYPVLRWLYPERFATHREFIGAYCIHRNGVFKLQDEMRTRMVYRRQAEVLKLPQASHRQPSIPLDEAQRVEYNKKAQNFIASLEERGTLDDTKMKIGAFVLQKLHDLRREAVEAKYLDAMAIVSRARKSGEKVVLYTTYVAAAKKLEEMLREYQPMVLTGVTSSLERARLVKEFATRSDRGVFIITAAGGESVDLTPANHFVFLNKPLTYADQDQAVKRVMRRGQRRPVTVHHLIAADTIDERIEALLQRKRVEFERVFHRDKEISRWFRDNERDNVRELVQEYIKHEQSRKVASRRGRGQSRKS